MDQEVWTPETFYEALKDGVVRIESRFQDPEHDDDASAVGKVSLYIEVLGPEENLITFAELTHTKPWPCNPGSYEGARIYLFSCRRSDIEQTLNRKLREFEGLNPNSLCEGYLVKESQLILIQDSLNGRFLPIASCTVPQSKQLEQLTKTLEKLQASDVMPAGICEITTAVNRRFRPAVKLLSLLACSFLAAKT